MNGEKDLLDWLVRSGFVVTVWRRHDITYCLLEGAPVNPLLPFTGGSTREALDRAWAWVLPRDRAHAHDTTGWCPR